MHPRQHQTGGSATVPQAKRRRRLVALLLSLLSSLLLFGVTAPAASAHAALLSTTPGDAEILQRSPAEVTLKFGEAVGTGLGGLRALDTAGNRVDTGVISQTDSQSDVHLALRPNLPQGTYVVIWRVVSADSHPVSGAFTFSVGKPSVDASKLLGRGNLTRLTAAPRGPSVVLGLTRFLGFSALMLLLGGSIFLVLLWRQGLPHLRRLLAGAALVEAVTALLAIGLEGPYAAGLGLAKSADPTLIGQVLGQTYGVATATRAVLSLVLLGLLLAARRLRAGRAVLVSLVGTSAAIAVTWSLAGHGGSGSWQPYAGVLDVVHLVTVSAWVGGLVVLGFGVRGRWSAADSARILPGWSRLASWSVGLLVASGIFASFRQVGELSALTSTRYGLLLLLKDALVALMLLFALVGRSYVRTHYTGRVAHAAMTQSVEDRPAPADDDDVASLRRSTAIETGLAVGVLAVTALLVNSVPAKDAFAPPYTGKSVAGPLSVAVDIYPARKGQNGLHIYTVGANGLTRDVAEVTGDIVRASDGEKITVHPRHKSLGHYEDLNLVIPAKGTWTIELQVRLDDVDSYPTTQRFTIK